ncbi:cytochrome P450 [Melanomma pulvis-pyrius CBS 109.77]|uniref:Cytochrome P450 n=1 Tax=Melanomma pulvis-pyrius CBS 109.77 TaxID=1314802 RepID=A0A6A6XBN3_9PLEO|nr:cytochrome P450 [Melanomma pulvis-pyrius CBS 109.77]
MNGSHTVVDNVQDHSGNWHSTVSVARLCTIFVLVLFGLKYVRTRESPQDKFWKVHPIPGPSKAWFGWIRATLASVQRSKELVDEGYQKYSRRNSIFTMPSFDRGGFIVIPPMQLKKLYGLPESRLDSFSSQLTAIQAQYTIEDLDILHNPFHAKILTNQLPKHLDELTKGMVQELTFGFEKYWDSPTSWKSVPAWSSSLSIVARSMNRIFIGAHVCRDEDFIEALKQHGTFVFASGFVINSIPWYLKPFVGMVVKLYGRNIRKKCLGPLLPLIEARLAKYKNHLRHPDYAWEAPKDAIQWAIEDSIHMEDKYQDAYQIGHRILLLNFASIHSTSLAVANTLQDLFSGNTSTGAVEDLREECIKVFTEYGGIWNQDAVAKLHLLDSAIRESMRVSSLSILGLPRRILDPNGVTIANDVHIPPGISIITPVEAIHLDPELHAKPTEYHAFRFCTTEQVKGKRNKQTQSTLEQDPIPTTSYTEEKSQLPSDYKFIPFGFGRHACPGRFFAMHQAKLLLAYVLMNYDIEFMEKRPAQRRFLWIQIPLDSTNIRIRKRDDAIWQTKFL